LARPVLAATRYIKPTKIVALVTKFCVNVKGFMPKIFYDKNVLRQKFFTTKCFTPKIFYDKNVFTPNFFYAQIFNAVYSKDPNF